MASILDVTAVLHERETFGKSASVRDKVDTARLTGENLADELGVNYAYARDLVDLAIQSRDRLAPAHEALQRGELDLPKLRALFLAGKHLDADDITEVQKRVLPRAEGRSCTAFARTVRYHATAVAPRRAEQQRQAAREERKLSYRSQDHGQAALILRGPAEKIRAMYDRCTARAKSLPKDHRSFDNKRFDVAGEFLLSSANATKPPATTINVTMEFATLLGLNRHPAHLEGYGPITADLARELAKPHNARFRRLTTIDGHLRHISDRYKPTGSQTEYCRLRDEYCIIPGCNNLARHADLDHGKPYRTTRKTRTDDLAALCRHHHRLKHLGVFTWHRSADETITIHYAGGRIVTVSPKLETAGAHDDP